MKQHLEVFTEDPLVLESGERLGPITVAYETFGTLNDKKDNVLLVCHALTGDSHITSNGDPDAKMGWWEDGFGPGRAIDTNRYFVICANVLGGCAGTTGPSSINPATGKPWGTDFPVVTIRDMVRVQAALLDTLGIERLVAVIGGSMGACQAMEWAVTYPERMDGIVSLAGTGRFHPQGIAFHHIMRRAIMTDPDFNNGQYYDGPGPKTGLATARMVVILTCRTDESYWKQFGRQVRPLQLLGVKGKTWDEGYGALPSGAQDDGSEASAPAVENELLRKFGTTYEVESYLEYNGQTIVNRFDANSFLYLTRAVDFHDVSRGYESMDAAYARFQGKALVIGVDTDIAFPPNLQQEQVEQFQKVGTAVEFAEIKSEWGHDAFLTEFMQVAPQIREFLDALQTSQVSSEAR